MIYFIILIAALAVLYFKFKKKSTINDQLSVAPFRQWFSEYKHSSSSQRGMLAASFITQTFHLATSMQAIPEVGDLFAELRKHDAQPIVDEWLDHSLPQVVNVLGEGEVMSTDARLIGVLMLVGNADLNFERGIRNFLDKMNAR